MSALMRDLSVFGVDACPARASAVNCLRRHPHAPRHVGEGSVDLLVDAVELVALEQLDFQFLVDQFVDHLLARRRLVGAELDELGALVDVVAA